MTSLVYFFEVLISITNYQESKKGRAISKSCDGWGELRKSLQSTLISGADINPLTTCTPRYFDPKVNVFYPFLRPNSG